jgi:hypothetical protein
MMAKESATNSRNTIWSREYGSPPARGRHRRCCMIAHHIFSQFYFQTAAFTGYGFAISRRDAPEFCDERPRLPEQRARGTPDAQRIRSPVCKSEKAHERSHHEHAGNIRRSARNGLRLASCSPRRSIALIVTVVPVEGFRSGWNGSPPNLTPASGRQDHTTWAVRDSVVVSASSASHNAP